MEMNLFLPQSIQTQIEIEEIADVKKQIINPSTSKTIIGVEQDGLVGSFNLTDPTVRIDWKNTMNIISYTSVDNFKNLEKKEYTGQELFSMIIPPKINLSKGEVKIVNGEIKAGKLSKDVLGAGKQNSIHQLIWDEYGAEETVKFLNNNQKLINNFNLYTGFSIGIDDIAIKKELEKQINCIFNTKDLKVEHMITELENNPELMSSELFEKSLYAELNVIRDDVAKLIQANQDPQNQINIMAKSGSKGDVTNSGQMRGCIGMQAVSGQIIQKKVNGRTLPYFFQNDDRGDARGLIKPSFSLGMGYPQFFFLNQAAREGIIDGAVKSVTGDTEIVIIENKQSKCVKIGEWINEKLEQNKKKVKFYPNDREMELLNINSKQIYIPTTDEDGKVSWGEITAITKHNPSEQLYEIKTHGGRKVIVTESKSLLIWNKQNKKYEQKSTPEVKLGDYMPVTMKLAEPPIITKYIDMSDISEKFELNKDNGIFIGLLLAESSNIDTDNGYIQLSNNNINFIKLWFDKYSIKYTESEKIIIGYSITLAKFLTKLIGSINKFVPDTTFSSPTEFIVGLLNGYISSDSIITEDSIQVSSMSSKLIDGINMLLSRLGIFGETELIENINFLSIRSQWAVKFANQIELIDSSKQDKLNKFNISTTLRTILRTTHCNFTEQNDTVLDKITNINIINVKDYPEYAKVYDLTIPSTLNFGLANGLHVVDTAESGYIQRKLVKTLEDLVIKYDSTLRTVNNTIIQFIYGDTGADTRYQYEYNMKLIEQNNIDIENMHKFTPQELKEYKFSDNFSDKDNDKLIKTLINMRNELRHSLIKSKLDYITLNTSFLLPVNITRIINSVRHDDDLKGSKDKLEPQYILDRIDDLMTNEHTKLMVLSKDKDVEAKKSYKIKDEQINKTSFKYALYDCLSPKRAIIEYGLNKNQFEAIFSTISENFNKNIIQPGEHAGILSAQAMGEPTTQMSTTYGTLVHIYDTKTNTINKIQIGKFIDDLMKENKDKVVELKEHKNSTVLDLENRYKIVNVSGKGKTAWETIEQISKHPANGKLMTVTTRSGKYCKTTMSHSYLKRTKNSIVPIRGSKLKIGNRIPITRKIKLQSNINKLEKFDFELDKHFGWVCGAYLADGSIRGSQIRICKINKEFSNNIVKFAKKYYMPYRIKNYQGEYGPGKDTIIIYKFLAIFLRKYFSTGSFDKQISGEIFHTNKEFIAGIISGYFDGDGNINVDRNLIRASSRSKQLIEDMSILLNYFGIFSVIYTEKEKGENKQPFYTINIQHKYAKIFKNEIGLIVPEKLGALNQIIDYLDRNDVKSLREDIDMIPELGETITKVADYLKIPGRSSLYRRYLKKEAIGRETLGKYVETFNGVFHKNSKELLKQLKPSEFTDLIILLSELKDAYESDVVWDEIINIEYHDEPVKVKGEPEPEPIYVYDFSVPGNDSFMVNNGVLVHNTLKAFHQAGISAISNTLQGVPRVKELLSLSKKIKTPQMILYLNNEYYKNKEMAHKIASYIRFTTLGQIKKSVEVFYDPNPYIKDGFMEKDNVYNIYYTHNPTKSSCQVDINNLPWLMRIELDREKMLEKEVTLLEIKSKFCNQWEKRYSDIKNIKKEEKYILDKIIQTALLSNTDNDAQPVIHLRFDMTEFDFNTLNEFIDIMVERFKLKGITGINEKTIAIEERVMKFDDTTGGINKEEQYVIYTQGVNLMDIRYLIGVDIYKTICNDVVQMYETFGIEAARAIIVREIALAYKRHGADVNYIHLSVIVDLMTSYGMLMSVDRHGMNKTDNEPLARISFEKMVEQIITAAVFNEVDNMKSVSSRIMAGQVVIGGTGFCNVILDTKLLEKSEFTEDLGVHDSVYKDINTSTIIEDTIKNEEAGDIFMPM